MPTPILLPTSTSLQEVPHGPHPPQTRLGSGQGRHSGVCLQAPARHPPHRRTSCLAAAYIALILTACSASCGQERAARHWAARIGVKLTRLQPRPMRSKWGSISTAGRLTLNTDLVNIPKPLGEFVIVHELVHLFAPNHGKVFKSSMHAYLPDWQQRERELRRLGQERGPASAAERRRS